MTTPAPVSLNFNIATVIYNINIINEDLNNGNDVILDRYVYSNLAHQGGKIKSKKERLEMYEWLEKLEFELLSLPHADIKVFLHMPYEVSCILKKDRQEKPDQHEAAKEHLLMAESAYKEIADMYDFKTIECNIGNKPKKIEEINEELFNYIYKNLN